MFSFDGNNKLDNIQIDFAFVCSYFLRESAKSAGCV